MRTQVAIVGAGPAGLMLSHLLALEGIDSVVLEDRSRDYVERRLRAGVLEQGTADLLRASGVGERMDREGLVHHGIELRFGGEGHRIGLSDLTGGKAITIYGQQEVVKDLIAARLADGGDIRFEVSDVRLEGLASDRPTIAFTDDGAGGARIGGGSGLRGLQDRLSALDGTLSVDSPEGGGTRLRARIPCGAGPVAAEPTDAERPDAERPAADPAPELR